jgi:hypothetical protein
MTERFDNQRKSQTHHSDGKFIQTNRNIISTAF